MPWHQFLYWNAPASFLQRYFCKSVTIYCVIFSIFVRLGRCCFCLLFLLAAVDHHQLDVFSALLTINLLDHFFLM